MADNLCSSTASSLSSYNLMKNNSFHLITSIILHDLFLIYSFIISYPLYFSYFIYFSPYFIKLVCSISPLFIATVVLSLLSTTTVVCPNLPQLKLGILQTVVHKLKSNLNDVNGDDDVFNFEDFEIYKIVFDRTLLSTICNEEVTPMRKIAENSAHGGRGNDITTNGSDIVKLGNVKISEDSAHGGRRNDVGISDSDADKTGTGKIPENLAPGDCRIDVNKLEDEKGFEKLLEELNRFEDFTTAIATGTNSNKVTEEFQKAEQSPEKNVGSGSEAESVASNSSINTDKFSQNSGKSSSWRSNSSSILSSHGSMREEKEWRKTLACKLFEERHNSRGGEEGMDSLWEAYENDNSKNRKETLMMKKNSINNGGIKSLDYDNDYNVDDEEGEEEMSNGHLCCLQALKLSTGKMNLGMGKPNFVKISKALKGFGWLHHVKNKNGKKS